MAARDLDTGHSWLVDLPPTSRQTWSAIAVVGVALVGFAACLPSFGTPLAQLNAFFPSLDAIVLVTGLITSVLLFVQFSMARSRPLLVLASGYLFTALIVIPHALTFSGAFSPNGLLGAGPQTGSWLFIFWHVGFAVALLVYAGLRGEKPTSAVSETSTRRAIGLSVVAMGILASGLTWLATAGAALLPPLVVDQTLSSTVIYPISLTILILVAALVLLVRRRSVLDQWLMVIALVSILELVLSGLLPSVRFSLGFYAGRVLSLITSSLVLIVLLAETTRLYLRLAHSNALLRREWDNKLMNLQAVAASISHEIKQPLTCLMAYGEAGLRFLNREPPDIEEVRSALTEVINESRRAGETLGSIRALFGKSNHDQEQQIDANELALKALQFVRPELSKHFVTADVDLAASLPRVSGSRGQLQEVITNLLHNAIEAMAATQDGRRVLTLRTKDHGKSVVLEVEDTGPGIDPNYRDRIFEPFVTTKAGGTGLGLAISQMIVERHHGELYVLPASPRGTIFRLVLPQAEDPLAIEAPPLVGVQAALLEARETDSRGSLTRPRGTPVVPYVDTRAGWAAS